VGIIDSGQGEPDVRTADVYARNDMWRRSVRHVLTNRGFDGLRRHNTG